MNYDPPHPISDIEWNEPAVHPVARNTWHLEPNDTGEDLSVQVDGAKFECQHDINPHEVMELNALTTWLAGGEDHEQLGLEWRRDFANSVRMIQIASQMSVIKIFCPGVVPAGAYRPP